MANFLKSLFVKGVEIDTAGASSGNVLSYDGTKFAPAVPGSGSIALNDLSDVIVSSPEEFQSLIYDGTTWVNKHASTVTYVRNAESTTLTTGTVVYLFGATGDHATVKRADMTSDTTSSKTVGVVAADITASNNGPVVTRGYVDGIDLSVGYTAGDVLWLGDDGAFTKTKATAPDHLVFVGVVVRATNNGIIYVATQNGYELDELHNVSLPSPNSGDFLKYNGSLWVADAIDLGTDTTGNYMSGISGTSPVSVSHTPAEGSSATVSLDSGYGDTQNPYASKTANYFLASPNGSSGAPTFRAIVAADIPTLNQNTTGTAANITASSNTTLTSLSNLTTVGTLSSLSVSGNLTVDTNVLYVDATNNRVGINVTPLYALDVIGEVSVQSSSWAQDGIRLQGRAGGTSSYDVILTPSTLSATRTLTLPDVTGTVITTGNLSSITSTGTLSSVTSTGTISGLVITGDDTNSPSISLKGWVTDTNWAAVESNRGHLLLGHGSNTGGIYLRSNSTATTVYIGANTQNTLAVGYSGSAYTVTISGEAYCDSWWRSTGATGWYNQTYGGGIYMADSTWIRTYNSKRFLADSGLNVGGTTNNSTLNVIGGTAWFSAMSAGGGSYVVNNFGFLQYVSSRRELKENITTVQTPAALNRVLALRPVEFTMKPEYVLNSSELTPFDIKRGFIAQEVAEVDHWYGQWGWVDENQMMATDAAIQGELPLEESTPIYWNHDAVIADLVACIQNLNSRIAVLETQNNAP